MAVNKVTYNGNTLIDLTADTVTANKLGKGITAHNQSGAKITGTVDICGYFDSVSKTIRLYGDLAKGTYPVMYVNADDEANAVSLGDLVLTDDNILTNGAYTIQFNKRWSASSKAYSACNGMISFDIPIADVLNKTIRFKGFPANTVASSSSKPIWITKDSTGTRVSILRGTSDTTGNIWSSSYLTNEGNGVYSIAISETTFSNMSNATHLNINMAFGTSSVTSIPDGVIMTIDKPIS